MTTQQGYDALAEAYEEAFPDGYASVLERHAVALLADEIAASGLTGTVVDVGCGTGHVTADLAARGLDAVGVDPSRGMLEIARCSHRDVRYVAGDASLDGLDDGDLAGLLARFSLIHLPPDDVPAVVQSWAGRLQPGARVVVAFQCADDADDLGGRVRPPGGQGVAVASRRHVGRAGVRRHRRAVAPRRAAGRRPSLRRVPPGAAGRGSRATSTGSASVIGP